MKKSTSPLNFLLLFSLLLTLLCPIAGATSYIPESFPPVEAASAILLDADYNEVLYQQNADERRYPASITKVMTGLLTIEAVESGQLSMDTVITLGDDLYTGIGEGGSSQGLKTGEMLTVQDLLYCVLLPSANEACNALAVAVSGSIPTFVEQMNQRAAELGMDNTHFANTHGYHDESHYTTARDISKMCLEAMRHADFREIVSSTSYTVPATNLHEARELHDTNALVSNFRTGRSDLLYRYAIGIKTGYTPEAGYCLASAAEKNGRVMLAVVLGGKNYKSQGESVARNYFTESRALLEYGLTHFSRKTILDQIDPIATIPVTLCAEQDYVTVQPATGLEATLENDLDPALFSRTVTLPETLEAPVQQGQVLGTITLSYEGKDYGTVDLVAATTLERSQFLAVWEQVKLIFSKTWVKILLLVVIFLILFFTLRRAIFGPSRRKNRRRNRERTYSSSYRGRR